jgi:hypothetical protein
MVGAHLMFVKNRDDQFNLGSFLSSHLQGQAQIVSYCPRRTRGVLDRAFREHKNGWACPVPFS